MPNKTARTPRYVQIADEIRQLISAGHYSPGDRLPTVAEMAVIYQSNHCTISASVKHLAQLGLVESRKRAGVVVKSKRVLARSGERSIAFVLSVTANRFGALLIDGAEQAARARGYRLTIGNSSQDIRQERQLLSELADTVAGILVIPVGGEDNVGHYTGLVKSGMPLVFVDQFLPGVPAPVVSADHAAGAAAATGHLLRNGCNDVYILVGGHGSSMEARIEGFRRALAAAGRECPSDLILQAPYHGPEDGYQLARSLLLGNPRTGVIGFFATTEEMAHGVYAAVRESGRQVGHEVRVAGFGDIATMFMDPPLTTMRQDGVSIGEIAAGKLIDMIESGNASDAASVLLRTELVVRKSCHPAPSWTMHELLAAGGLASTRDLTMFQ